MTAEEQESLDRSLASSCSLGPDVAKAAFDVIHLRGLALILSASGTPRAPTHTAHEMTQISDRTSMHHIHIFYETTQEEKTPKAISHCT